MKRVLIVDDAAFMRISIKKTLENNGFQVVGDAENGMVGVQKYNELRPDIVTMDITMPEMDGLQALKAIKQIDPSANIIMVSAMGQQNMVKDAIIAGAKGFIVKPFKEDALLGAVGKI